MKGVLAGGLRNRPAFRPARFCGSTALCSTREQSKTRFHAATSAFLKRRRRPGRATAARMQGRAFPGRLTAHTAEEEEERPPKLITESGAPCATTGNGQRSPRERSKEEPTNWAVKGARNPPRLPWAALRGRSQGRCTTGIGS